MIMMVCGRAFGFLESAWPDATGNSRHSIRHIGPCAAASCESGRPGQMQSASLLVGSEDALAGVFLDNVGRVQMFGVGSSRIQPTAVASEVITHRK